MMGDGIMALFGAPVAHEDHAVRACYAALDMQPAMRRYAEEVRRSHGMALEVRVGLNSGEVVVRAIGSDLHMDYTAIGQTTHLVARMEQLATSGRGFLTTGLAEVVPVLDVPTNVADIVVLTKTNSACLPAPASRAECRGPSAESSGGATRRRARAPALTPRPC